jgi:glutamate-ammonia-ligase adenylyltransferase
LVRDLFISRAWQGSEPQDLLRVRRDQERGAAELNIKRGRGGTLDVEWLVQLLQLRNAALHAQVLVPGTQPALQLLATAGSLDRDDAEYFAESYRFLRRIESALRLLDTPARHDLPQSPLELSKLALLLGQPNGETVLDRTIMTLAENRRRFERIIGSI